MRKEIQIVVTNMELKRYKIAIPDDLMHLDLELRKQILEHPEHYQYDLVNDSKIKPVQVDKHFKGDTRVEHIINLPD